MTALPVQTEYKKDKAPARLKSRGLFVKPRSYCGAFAFGIGGLGGWRELIDDLHGTLKHGVDALASQIFVKAYLAALRGRYAVFGK